MPRENRKRGKKHKKRPEESEQLSAQHEEPVEEPQAGPSWIVSAPAHSEFNEEAPYGYVDSEVKAYFRTVDVQIREWQDEHPQAAGGDESDPNEDRRLFFVAALTEMSGKEKELATDPDCSTILERMAYSMDDFARRVFMDRLTGSYKTLVKHRFASHVCQTFLEVASETITRETRGILPPPPEDPSAGELPLMSDMISDICDELLPDFTDLLMDPFASHPCRAVLALLMPNLFPTERASTLRSKKSAAYKARQGPMKSLFAENSDTSKAVPPKFATLAENIMRSVREKLSANEVRALAASPVASPVLQMLLEVEAAQNLASEPGSLADWVLDGLVTRQHEGTTADVEASDYVGTLLRDPTSSHLLETLVRRLESRPFDIVWAIYLNGKLARLSVHPVANFVVGKALERVNEKQLLEACEELRPVSEKLFKSSRTGLIRSIVDRAGQLSTQEQSLIPAVLQMILAGLELSDSEQDRQLVVPCLLRLLSKEDYQKAEENQKLKSEKEDESKRRPHREQTEDPMAPKTQGALILQSLLRLPAPHNQLVLESLSMEDLIAMTRDVTASRVLDVILTSPTVSFKEKRRFVMHFIGHYQELVDDRIGSRVTDNCWAFADPYLKVSSIPGPDPARHSSQY
ncbi:hypothetical protein NM688_g7124 [Phlebia brevispora]|uniref:Uncharacterized protein n=1 Tax=Phlebia brevispora TaxID=194682 RepID=A0ACC1S9C9_9APHY|nr:hypothetical protein NM688_g7124 [Phlebia brevispora]